MNTLTRSLLLSVGLAALVLPSAAQITAPTPAKTDEIVTLSEFSVSSGNDVGYMPAESTSGSRVAVKIKDLPYAVNVITSEFLRDFNIFDLTEESALPSSVNGLDQGGNFNVRGFGGNVTLRNGFARLGNFDSTAADRIEFIKGPAAAIYGQTAPGGIVNIITKQPRTTASQRISASYGSYDNTRTDLESTGPIPLGKGAPKLFYIADASYFHRTYEGQALSTLTRSAYFALLYKFSAKTRLTFDFDYNFTRNNNVVLPEQIDPTVPTTSTNRYVGLATGISRLLYSNPSDWNRRIIYTYEGTFEHRFNDVLSMRVGGNIYRTPRFSYSSGGLTNYNPVTRTLTRTQKPSFSFLRGDGESTALDLVASYKVGPTTNKTLFTVDYYNNQGDRPSYSAVNNVGAATASVDALTPVPYVPFRQSTVGTDYVTTRFANDYAKALGSFLRHQIWAFDDKFIAVAGIRYDNVTLFKHDGLTLYPAGTPRAGQHVDDAKITGIDNFASVFGFNYRLTPDITFYGSRAESFVPAQPSALNLATSPVVVVPNQTGLGYETGFKVDALEHRLRATVALYEIALHHLQVTEIDPANPTNTILTFDGGQKSRGVELDANWRVTDKLIWLGTYSYTQSRATDRGVDHDLMSRQFLKIPYH